MWRADCGDRGGGRRVEAHCEEVRQDGRPVARAPRRKLESEVLAPYEGKTGSWLDDDCKNWRKQRHTAVRACVRLRDEVGYDGSCSTVRRYVNSVK